ncbi:MAG: hypothetical protein BWY77_01678 [bacterium ADurb.Bin431]|nr:MAG: hypothetical protein BWY77_01678 [bacterium ADurb.Bin431]
MAQLVGLVGRHQRPWGAALRPDGHGVGEQARRRGGEKDLAGLAQCLDDYLALAAEEAPLPAPVCALVRFMAGGIAIGHPDDPARTLQFEMDELISHRHLAACPIARRDRHHAEILLIGADRAFVRRQVDPLRRSCGLDGCGQPPARAPAGRLEPAGLIGNPPGEVAVARHAHPAEGAAVEKKFDTVAVAVHPNLDLLPLAARPVPVRKEVEHILSAPPGLIVKIVVLGKAAHIHDAKVGVDAGPAVRGGLAAVVEPGPDESPAQPGPVRVKTPPVLRGRSPGRVHRVIVADVAFEGVVGVKAAGADRASLLGADEGLVGTE